MRRRIARLVTYCLNMGGKELLLTEVTSVKFIKEVFIELNQQSNGEWDGVDLRDLLFLISELFIARLGMI